MSTNLSFDVLLCAKLDLADSCALVEFLSREGLSGGRSRNSGTAKPIIAYPFWSLRRRESYVVSVDLFSICVFRSIVHGLKGLRDPRVVPLTLF